MFEHEYNKQIDAYFFQLRKSPYSVLANLSDMKLLVNLDRSLTFEESTRINSRLTRLKSRAQNIIDELYEEPYHAVG